MRITILMHGLVLSAFMVVQTFLVSLLSRAVTNAESAKVGGFGIVMALLWLMAGTLVVGALVAGIVFGVDGVVGLASSSTFPVLAIGGGTAVVLAALSLEDWCMNRRGARQVTVA